MTREQRRLLLTMQAMDERGERFSFTRLCDAMDRSKGNMHRGISVLVALGHVRRVPIGFKRALYQVVRPVEPRVQYFAWDSERQSLREMQPCRLIDVA